MTPRKRFRQYLEGDSIGYPVSVFDPVSARLARHLGAELGILGGSIASAAVLGAPDVIILTLSELADQVRRIMRAADVSLLVDADHGYGNALSAMRTVEELEASGASALTLEDTSLPAAYGESSLGLVSVEEMVGKLRAGVSARRDPSLVVLARTSAPATRSTEEVRRRVAAYADTGVDGLMLIGITRREQLEAVREVTTLPLIMGGYEPDVADDGFLRANGVRVVVRGHQPFFVAMKALHDAMKHLVEGGAPEELHDAVASPDLQNVVLNADRYQTWEQQFLAKKIKSGE